MRIYIKILTVGIFVLASQAHAGISLSQTRLVFEAENKEENLTVRNESDQPILVQSWLDGGKAEDKAVPFAVTPPLTKLGAKGQQLLRLLYKGSGLPQDRESVVWLNVQEIPAKSDAANTLQIAVRQRIKVFYRPSDLTGSVADAPSSLQWLLEKDGKSISVHNPSAYHVSTLQIYLGSGSVKTLVSDRRMFAPGEKASLPVPGEFTGGGTTLSFLSINDWGGQQAFGASLQPNVSTQAALINK